MHFLGLIECEEKREIPLLLQINYMINLANERILESFEENISKVWYTE